MLRAFDIVNEDFYKNFDGFCVTMPLLYIGKWGLKCA
jgi:hypothetical protein